MRQSFPPHPAFGVLTRDEYRALALRHAELHLSFVEPVRRHARRNCEQRARADDAIQNGLRNSPERNHLGRSAVQTSAARWSVT